jgi:hypothetical protein
MFNETVRERGKQENFSTLPVPQGMDKFNAELFSG